MLVLFRCFMYRSTTIIIGIIGMDKYGSGRKYRSDSENRSCAGWLSIIVIAHCRIFPGIYRCGSTLPQTEYVWHATHRPPKLSIAANNVNRNPAGSTVMSSQVPLLNSRKPSTIALAEVGKCHKNQRWRYPMITRNTTTQALILAMV